MYCNDRLRLCGCNFFQIPYSMSTPSSAPSSAIELSTAATDILTDDISKLGIDGTHRSLKLLQLLNPSNKLKCHDLLVSDYLSDYRDSLQSTSTATIKILTWNLGQMSPTTQLETMVNLQNGQLPDIFICTFQETVSLRSFTSNAQVIDNWVNLLLGYLPSYSIIHKSGLLGLTSIIVASPKLAPQISDVLVETVGLGYLGWYNKGCISVKFRIGKLGSSKLSGTQVQLLNLHLFHGEDEPSATARVRSLQTVGNSISLVNASVEMAEGAKLPLKDTVQRMIALSPEEEKKLADASVSLNGISDPVSSEGTILLAGDLNFRIDGLDKAVIVNDSLSSNFAELKDHDELRQLRQSGKVFIGLDEGDIEFAPTYKVRSATEYDAKRRPAYTDRIVYTGVKEDVYGSYPATGSDHRPVYAEFTLPTSFIDVQATTEHYKTFERTYQDVIINMPLLTIDPLVVRRYCCTDIEEAVTFTFKNICDEPLSYRVEEQGRGFFRASTFMTDDNGEPIPLQSEKKITFTAKPIRVGTVAATYTVTLPGFNFSKTLSITLDVKSITGIQVEQLAEVQYDNLMNSFDFIIDSKNNFGLTKHLADAESVETLTALEKVILSDITLRTPQLDVLAEKNKFGNEGSVALIDVLHIWLKLLPEVNIRSDRGKKMFSKLISLIKFLGLDHEQAYEHFGFLFTDPYEILDYLESSVY